MKHRIPLFGGWLIVEHDAAAWDEAYAGVLRRAGTELQDGTATAEKFTGMTASSAVNGVLHIVSGVFSGGGSQASHECTHCTQILAEHIGMDLNREAEASAYLNQWFYDRLMGAM